MTDNGEYLSAPTALDKSPAAPLASPNRLSQAGWDGGRGLPPTARLEDVIPPPPPAPGPHNISWLPPSAPSEPPARPPTMDETDIRRIVEGITAATLAQSSSPHRPSTAARVAAIRAKVPPRIKTYGGAAVLIVGAGLAWRALSPEPVDTAQVTAVATQAATKQAEASTRAELERAKAASTQIVVADAFAWAPLPLTQTARSIIGFDPSTGLRTLDPARAEIVAKQARALLVGVPITALRLVSKSPTELQVTSNPGEGVALFESVVPAASTAPATATSALPTTTTVR